MKYTTPNYEVEAVETKDIITKSVAIPGADGNTAAYLGPSEDGNGLNLWVPDVEVLL